MNDLGDSFKNIVRTQAREVARLAHHSGWKVEVKDYGHNVVAYLPGDDGRTLMTVILAKDYDPSEDGCIGWFILTKESFAECIQHAMRGATSFEGQKQS